MARRCSRAWQAVATVLRSGRTRCKGHRMMDHTSLISVLGRSCVSLKRPESTVGCEQGLGETSMHSSMSQNTREHQLCECTSPLFGDRFREDQLRVICQLRCLPIGSMLASDARDRIRVDAQAARVSASYRMNAALASQSHGQPPFPNVFLPVTLSHGDRIAFGQPLGSTGLG